MNKISSYPVDGKFGRYGGRFVPEILLEAITELEKAYDQAKADPAFQKQLDYFLAEFVGRPTPLYLAENLTQKLDGAKIYLKREDLAHGGAHKINNTIAQAMLAKRMSKTRIIAETGAGQHGVATAIACVALGLKGVVYMGTEDCERQRLNVFRMKLLNTEVHPVDSGSKTLKDSINEAFRDWVTNLESTYYLIGSTMGPHPYPMIVRDFQSVIGKEIKQQFKQKTGGLPDALVACVGGGSNAMGTFYPFEDDIHVKLYGVEAAGQGIETGKHSATLATGTEGVFHGMYTYILQDLHGQISETYSVSAGLDYPGVGPEHSFLKTLKRADYVYVNDQEAVEAFLMLCKEEGILPALESSHALAYAIKLAPKMHKDQSIVVTLSGRGDKDVESVAKYMGMRI